MTTPYFEETIDGLTVKIYQDADGYTCNPRDNFRGATMVLDHNRYDLPKEIGFDGGDFDYDKDAIEAHIRAEYDAVAFAWVRGYDHGSLHLSLSDGYPFSDPWDSGTAGFMFVTREKQAECGTPDDLLGELMAGELAEYDQWANGEVYGFVIEDAEGNTLDSCWGFVGEMNPYSEEGYVLTEARDQARWFARQVADDQAVEDAEAALPIMAVAE